MKLIDSLLSSTSVDSDHPIRTFVESRDSITKFTSHFKRSSNPLMKRYASKVTEVLESHIEFPTDAGNRLIARVASDCRSILEASQNGERQRVSNMLPHSYSKVVEYSSMIKGFGPSGLGSTGTMTEDAKYTDEHTSFCKKFCKEFGVEADHFEEVAEGLFVYFDATNTDKLLRMLQFDLSNFSFENGYLLLRAGSVDDFSFGSFGEELSKWGFVYLDDK